jgi:tetratricopeptide (TPR) repeat protein
MRDIYRTPEFCASCHKAALPRQLNGYKWLRAFSVYDEWQQSAWAMQSPLPFYRKSGTVTCQNCHMPKVASGTDSAGHGGQVASHRWVAANTAIPTFFHYDEQLEKTKEFLKGAVSVDIFGFRNSDATKAPISVLKSSQPFDVRAGETITFDVVVQNSRIGHSFVPEQRDFYEAWCEFEVSDATGRTLLRSGYLKDDGQLEERAHTYETHLLSADGKLLDHHQVWDARIRAYDNTIMPGRGELVRYRVTLPANTQGPITAVARVNYRRFRKDFTDWVLGQKTSYPIVVVAEEKVELELGKNSAASADASHEFRRWNNYGIALLDQQEYDRAAHAFEHAVQLSPENVDGYINVAIAAASEGRYEDAHKWLTKAQARQPKDERALAYRGLVYRLQYKLDNAIEYLKQSVQSYAYFLKGDFQNARTQYEALQQVDPDSLEAHRYLSSVYSKLGLKDLATREAAAYAEELDNPAVAYLARSYWTSHPAVASESVRSHVHGQDSLNPLQRSVDELLKTSLIWPSD